MTPQNTAYWSAPPGPTQWDNSATGNNCVRQRIHITNPATQTFTLVTENTTSGANAKVAGLEFVAITAPDLPAMMGDASFSSADTGTTLLQKINALRSAGVCTCRVGLLPADYYPGGAAGVSAAAKTIVNTLLAQGITPYLEFQYYQQYQGFASSITDYDWTSIGSAYATYFGTSIPLYGAVNEPDLFGYNNPPPKNQQDPPQYIPTADYATALGNLATGIHGVNNSIKVKPGGYGFPGSFDQAPPSAAPGGNWFLCAGYPGAIATLLSSTGLNRLDGIDLHNYWSADTTVSNWTSVSQESQFQQVRSACGLGDVKLYCSEFNVELDGNSGATITEAQAAQKFLTLLWSIWTVTLKDGVTPSNQFALCYSLDNHDGDFGVFTVLSPWTPTARGVTLQWVAQLTAGMQFVSVSKGGCVMSGPNKRLWVMQNISGWMTPGANYTCTDIPANATRLLRYGYDGLRETVTISPGIGSYTFQDIPTGETTMIEALP